MAPVVEKGEESSAATESLDVPDNYKDDHNYQGSTCLDDVECVFVNRGLHKFQDSGCVKKTNVHRTVAKAFELATEFVRQEVTADAGS